MTYQRSSPELRSDPESWHPEKHPCSVCGKCFDRRDSLKRHHRIHSSQHQLKKTRKKACLPCVKSKTKCSEDYPACERCEKKQLTCLYTTHKTPNRLKNTIIEHHGNSNGNQEKLDHEQSFHSALADVEDGSFLENEQVSMVNVAYLNQDVVAEQSLEPGEASETLASASPSISLWPQTTFSQFTEVGDFYPMLLSPYSWEDAFEQSNSEIHGDPMTTNDAMQNAAELTMCPDLGVEAGCCALGYVPQPSGPVFQDPSTLSLRTQQPQRWRSSECDTTNVTTRVPFDRNIMTTTTSEPDPGPENSLSPLADNLDPIRSEYPRRFLLPTVNVGTHKGLLACLRLPLARSLWQSMSLVNFPSMQQIDYFLDLYFGHFDMLLPMIHRPTFKPSDDLTLTLSMCAIGVLYSGFDGAKAFAQSLSELLRRLLIFKNEQKPSASRSYSALAAQTLQSILGNSLGSRKLFEFGDNNRGLLVANARAMGLFARREMATTNKGIELQERWQHWIRKERVCRLAWCIYTFDASATYYRNCRPHLSLSELKLDLPCSSDHWEAETAHTWASLQPWAYGVPPSSPSFRETVGRLLEDVGPPLPAEPQMVIPAAVKITDNFHRTLMSTTMLRMVWDLREESCGPMFSVPIGKPLVETEELQKTGCLLTILRQLTTNALHEAAATTSFQETQDVDMGTDSDHTHSHVAQDFRGLVLRARISLVAQIIATDKISNHLDAEWYKGRVTDMSKAHEAAERSLRSWAVKHPSEPRRMAHVAAQLLAIARSYPCHLPREPYDTCRAGLLLWTMVPFIKFAEIRSRPRRESVVVDQTWRQRQGIGSSQRTQGQRLCQLDWLGSDKAEEAQTIRDWINHGRDGFVLCFYGIPDICTTQGRRQILEHTSDLLRKQHVWRSSDTYRDIVLQALQEGHGR